MFKRTVILAAALTASSLAHAQSRTPTHFDVISVKPHKAGTGNMSGWRWTSNGIEMTNIQVKQMLFTSAKVQPWLVFGLPPWGESATWDISAKVTDPEMKPIDKVTPDERTVLIGSILTDRFGLASHMETKVQPVFVMTLMPGEQKIHPSPPPPAGEPEPKFGRGMFMMNDGSAEAKYTEIKSLAEVLSRNLNRTVIDKTGLTGSYDFKLKWQPEKRSADSGATLDSDAPSSLIEAVREQLGLKMTADKASVPTVVVDKLVQPEEN